MKSKHPPRGDKWDSSSNCDWIGKEVGGRFSRSCRASRCFQPRAHQNKKTGEQISQFNQQRPSIGQISQFNQQRPLIIEDLFSLDRDFLMGLAAIKEIYGCNTNYQTYIK
jgi:hypothetical protein